jgi:2-hydroxy-3-keto-5-methylthiopentenyl-1-phosphate phosphatase
MPVLPYPELYRSSPFIVLSDWDGTITSQDSNDFLTDNLGMGYDKRREMNKDVLSGENTFRDSFRQMLRSVVENGHSFDECKEVLRKSE